MKLYVAGFISSVLVTVTSRVIDYLVAFSQWLPPATSKQLQLLRNLHQNIASVLAGCEYQPDAV